LVTVQVVFQRDFFDLDCEPLDLLLTAVSSKRRASAASGKKIMQVIATPAMNMNIGRENECDVLKVFHASQPAYESKPPTSRMASGWRYIITDILEPEGAASIRPWICSGPPR